MIPTTWGGNLVPQGRRRLCRGQGEEILGRLGAARQRQRGPHLTVFLTLATHLRRPPEDVARNLVTQILGDHVAGARDDAVRHGDPSRPQPPDDLVRHFRCDREVRSLHPAGRLDFERIGGAHVPIGRDLVAQALDEGALRRRERIGHNEQVRPDTTAAHDNPTMIGVEHQRGVDLRAVVPQLRGFASRYVLDVVGARPRVPTTSCPGSRNSSLTATPWSSKPPGLPRRSSTSDFIPFWTRPFTASVRSWADVSLTGVSRT